MLERRYMSMLQAAVCPDLPARIQNISEKSSPSLEEAIQPKDIRTRLIHSRLTGVYHSNAIVASPRVCWILSVVFPVRQQIQIIFRSNADLKLPVHEAVSCTQVPAESYEVQDRASRSLPLDPINILYLAVGTNEHDFSRVYILLTTSRELTSFIIPINVYRWSVLYLWSFFNVCLRIMIVFRPFQKFVCLASLFRISITRRKSILLSIEKDANQSLI